MDATDDPQLKHLIGLCEDAVLKIAEHADSVQLFFTRQSDDGKREIAGYEIGSGNIYARQGQVAEWLVIQQEYQRQWAIRNNARLQSEQ